MKLWALVAIALLTGGFHEASAQPPTPIPSNETRSLDEIQFVFDRAKSSFYAMYLRALRENKQLAGKVVLSITIAPAGHVSEAHIVSSELGDSELEAKIISKVRSLNFGAKNVPEFTHPNYPIKFESPA